METKWLEDFVSLAETRSFSRSALLRHVTQPAFSRRIQALEAWAGTDLVDRSSYPTRLTLAGETLRCQAMDILQSLASAHAMLRGHPSTGEEVVDFAAPHTLAFTFFPAWITGLQCHFGEFKSSLTALNVHDAALRLVEGGCDVLITYHHPSQPLQLDPHRFEMVSLGGEVLAPFVKTSDQGAPLFNLPGESQAPVPYLAYSSGAYLGRVADYLVQGAKAAIHLNRVYETDMAESLKAMALEGHGVAFLPNSAVHKEVATHKLTRLRLANKEFALEATLEIRAYREKPQQFRPPTCRKEALWSYLMAQTLGTPTHLHSHMPALQSAQVDPAWTSLRC